MRLLNYGLVAQVIAGPLTVDNSADGRLRRNVNGQGKKCHDESWADSEGEDCASYETYFCSNGKLPTNDEMLMDLLIEGGGDKCPQCGCKEDAQAEAEKKEEEGEEGGDAVATPTCNKDGKLDPSYNGEHATTVSGITCQKWTSQSPHKHKVLMNTQELQGGNSQGLGDHNYCRAPGGMNGAWCYTTDPGKRWEYCSCEKKEASEASDSDSADSDSADSDSDFADSDSADSASDSASDSAEGCPSTTCWKKESGRCVLKDDCPNLTVSCSSEGMDLKFPRDLFDSDGSTKFYTGSDSDDCDATDDGQSLVTWKSPLGKCGMTVEKTDSNVLFTKTITTTSTGGSAVTLTNHEGNAVEIFTGDGIQTSVTFECKFPLTAIVSSEEVKVNRPDSISATAVGVGNWEKAFLLEFFDAEFTQKIDSVETNIGGPLYVQASFVISEDVPDLRWFIQDCTIIEGEFKIKIIKDTCYSMVVNSKYVGDSSNDPADAKIIQADTKFQYNSFRLGSDDSPKSTQTLECSIVFCTNDDNSAQCDLNSKTCPAAGDDALFKYTVYGTSP